MWSLTYAFFAETFQPMNAALTLQIGLNDCLELLEEHLRLQVSWKVSSELRPSISE